jgi:hypothetical protein
MNNILLGYKNFVLSNGNVDTVELHNCKSLIMKNGYVISNKEINQDSLKDIDNLKNYLIEQSIFSIKGYDDYINLLCDTFKIECCFTCDKYVFLDDLDCCEGCDEYICNNCIDTGCTCGDGVPDEDDYQDNISCYYL